MQHLQNPTGGPSSLAGSKPERSSGPTAAFARLICLTGRRWRGVPFAKRSSSWSTLTLVAGGTGEHESQPAPTGSVGHYVGRGETRSIEIQQLRELKGPLVDVRSQRICKGHWPGPSTCLFSTMRNAPRSAPPQAAGRTQAIHLGLELTGEAAWPGSWNARDQDRIYCWRGECAQPASPGSPSRSTC